MLRPFDSPGCESPTPVPAGTGGRRGKGRRKTFEKTVDFVRNVDQSESYCLRYRSFSRWFLVRGMNWMNISSMPSSRSIAIFLFQVVTLSCVFFALAVFAADIRFGSLAGARTYYAGTRVFAETPILRGYYDPSDSSMTLRYSIINLSDIDVPIIGASSSCACSVANDLPKIIPARRSVTVEVRTVIDETRPDRKLSSAMRIFVSHRRHREILLKFELLPMRKIGRAGSNQNSVFNSESEFWRILSTWVMIPAGRWNRIEVLFDGGKNEL